MSAVDFAKYGKNKRYDLSPDLLDIHVPRMIEAHKRASAFFTDSELLRSGLIRIENFLGAELSGEVKEDILDGPILDARKPTTLLVHQYGKSFNAIEPLWAQILPLFDESVHKRVKALLEQQTYLQHLLNEPDDQDDQKVFHSDTFFPCMKFWYFPHSVSVDEGPFWYVPYSTELNDKLIGWHTERVEDLKAGRAEAWRGQGHLEGSFRISPDEIHSLGLKETPICVNADTLIIGNVFGFHRRGDVKKPTHRASIHGSIRMNPFA